MAYPHLALLKDRTFRTSLGVGIVVLFLSLLSVYYSMLFATKNASNSVEDLILSNTPVYDVGLFFVYGAFIAVLFSIYLTLGPLFRAAPFMLKATALFLFTRSIFVSLTHISPYPYHAELYDTFLMSATLAQTFFTGDDLFFSGHVGLTFLMALLVWERPLLRYAFLTLSVLFAITVLLGHLHYSIDVFAAYFITYTIYILATRWFKSDYARAGASTHHHV
jgi:hypothetical protein